MRGAFNPEFLFLVVYVVASDRRDAYAHMALVSMLSVQISKLMKKVCAWTCSLFANNALIRIDHVRCGFGEPGIEGKGRLSSNFQSFIPRTV